MNLSKSSFIRGVQCYKSLYLKMHQPDLEDAVSESQQAVFNSGTNVGLLAQKLYPYGVDLGEYMPENYNKAFKFTDSLLTKKKTVIYEAGFKFEKLLCFMDILTKDGNNINTYEVKGSTSVKDYYYWDTAFQYLVMTSAGYEINDISVIHLNKNYIKKGDIDVKGLFTIVSVKDEVLALQPKVKDHIFYMNEMLNNGVEPTIDIGPHCSNPYGCSFRGHCWQHLPDDSIFSYKGIKTKTTWDLYKSGIYKLEDIPNNFPLNNTEQLVVSSTKQNISLCDKTEISSFCDKLNYPLYFLDFETIYMVPIPIYDNSSPFQQIPFQYSLHIQEDSGKEPVHKEFLAEADKNKDPRIPFIEHLIEHIGAFGDIIVYNATFEKRRLNEIKTAFPKYTDYIDNILYRVVDLMSPFRSRQFYKPEMKGGYSIKNVLPALVPNLSYNDLKISNGEAASNTFISMINETDELKISEIRSDLLRYCELDTWAMVKILNVMKNQK